MEQLDEFLLSRHLDLDEKSTDDDKSDTGESFLRLESLTASLLRNDVVAPHIIHFTSTYNPKKRKVRRVMAFVIAVAISLSSLFHFSKVVLSLSHEATLDIETKMIPSKTTTTNLTASNSTGKSRPSVP
jgi:hypothetical protein